MREDHVLLMKPDYCAEPFWRRDGANVQMSVLPLSETVRSDLRAWLDWFESSEYWEHSTDELRYFATDEETDAFESEGVRLWLEVRELTQGTEWLVGYQSLTRHERIWEPEKLPRALRRRPQP